MGWTKILFWTKVARPGRKRLIKWKNYSMQAPAEFNKQAWAKSTHVIFKILMRQIKKLTTRKRQKNQRNRNEIKSQQRTYQSRKFKWNSERKFKFKLKGNLLIRLAVKSKHSLFWKILWFQKVLERENKWWKNSAFSNETNPFSRWRKIKKAVLLHKSYGT